MANQLTRYATVATVDTAGEGYFIGVGIYAPASLTGTGTIVSANDEVQVFQFVLPFRVVVRNIVTSVVTQAGAGKKYGVGLYDVDKNLVLETGAIAGDGGTVKNKTSITAVTLEPGVYYHAQTTDDAATLKMLGYSFSAAPQDVLNEQTEKRWAKATNTASAGVLPATLGDLTNVATRSPVFTSYEP